MACVSRVNNAPVSLDMTEGERDASCNSGHWKQREVSPFVHAGNTLNFSDHLASQGSCCVHWCYPCRIEPHRMAEPWRRQHHGREQPAKTRAEREGQPAVSASSRFIATPRRVVVEHHRRQATPGRRVRPQPDRRRRRARTPTRRPHTARPRHGGGAARGKSARGGWIGKKSEKSGSAASS